MSIYPKYILIEFFCLWPKIINRIPLHLPQPQPASPNLPLLQLRHPPNLLPPALNALHDVPLLPLLRLRPSQRVGAARYAHHPPPLPTTFSLGLYRQSRYHHAQSPRFPLVLFLQAVLNNRMAMGIIRSLRCPLLPSRRLPTAPLRLCVVLIEL